MNDAVGGHSGAVPSPVRGRGETGDLVRCIDWSCSAVGAMARWPASLRAALSMMLGSRYPMFLWWGAFARQFLQRRLHPRARPAPPLQVISNLLNNAARYTEAGGRIALALGRGDSHAIVTVRDSGIGIGIGIHMLDRILEMFERGERGKGRSDGGLGIGLTLAKRLVELHRGTIEARSARFAAAAATTRRISSR